MTWVYFEKPSYNKTKGKVKVSIYEARFRTNFVFHIQTHLLKVYALWHSLHLLIQSQQRKHQNNVWNLLRFIYKDTRTTSVILF